MSIAVTQKPMNRRPPKKIRKALRKEVGFGCPVPGCGRPYLEWHHFDPPWHSRPHHNVEGMIALCREHHIQADSGAFTTEQLRFFKRNGRNNWHSVKGKFNWLRNKLLVSVGGNYYYNTVVPIQIKQQPIIWFNRDRKGYLLLNLNMLTISGQPRARLRDNEWFNVGLEEDIECPPSAKRLEIRYPNGDRLKVEYSEMPTIEAARTKLTSSRLWVDQIKYPLTMVEITIDVADTNLHIVPSKALFGSHMTGCFAMNARVGLMIE